MSDGESDDWDGRSGEPAAPAGDDGPGARERDGRDRPTLSSDGSIDPVVGLAAIAGVVGGYAAARDLLRGRPTAGLEYLWMGTPALLAAGIAALDGRLLTAGGLGAVALATLVEGYGWFGAGDEGEERANGSEEHRDENGRGESGR